MEVLKKKRTTIKRTVTRFQSYLSKFEDDNNTNLTELEARLSKIEQQYETFDEIQGEIEQLSEDQSDNDREREEFENSYFKVVSAAKEKISISSATTGISQLNITQASTQHSQSATSQIKLPTLNLPTFSGVYDQWRLYQNTFTSVIDSNEGLSNTQKFQYLRASLSGDALQMINSLNISDENYKIAWKLLSDRYQNTRMIVCTHVRSLFDLPSIQKESSSALRQLLDNYQKNIHALAALNQKTDTWDTLLIHLISNKLDFSTRKEWECLVSKKNHEEMPTMVELNDFLQHRCQLLEMLDKTKEVTKQNTVDKKYTNHPTRQVKQSTSNTYVVTSNTCPLCNMDHQIYQCEKFLALSAADKMENAKTLKLCFNCLKPNHPSSQCRGGRCRKCHKKHNTLLHLTNTSNNKATDDESPTASTSAHSPESQIQSHHTTSKDPTVVLLSTAVVKMYDNHGQEQHLRALLDSGSQSNFMSKKACHMLGLIWKSANLKITGVNNTVSSVTEVVTATIHSRLNAYKSTLSFFVMDKITDKIPAMNVARSSIEIPNHIQLADPTFYQASDIDLLIGAELFYDIMCIGQIKESRQSPIFQKSQFGWIISGRVTTRYQEYQEQTSCNFGSTIEDSISRFWEIEEFAELPNNEIKDECEEHYKSTHKRNEDGTFTVRLPFKTNIKELGESKATAIKRFESLERKFERHPDIKKQYVAFMSEYEELGHMTKLTHIDSTPVNYLPHHPVLKPDSLTTKLRVVFDGSAKTSTNVSLNETLMKGPTIQQDLIFIVLRFRKYNVVITSDIEKMYRQIRVHTADTNYQLILWRTSEALPIETFRLNTVTYGTTSAPFLSVRCLKQLAEDERAHFPYAVTHVLESDFYVDDLISGADTIEEATALKHSLTNLLKKGGFHLRKWRSNVSEVIQETPTIINDIFNIDKQTTAKTLGLIWNSQSDVLQFTVKPLDKTSHATKRHILSIVSQIYDPLGLIGPVLTRAKILLQQLWQLKIDWDESVPITIHTAWTKYRSELEALNSLSIPRRLSNHDTYDTVELHGFSDASQVAYGACIFVRTTSNGKHSVRLLCSKSRVAPLKTISVPRLELCGGVLLANLMEKVKKALEMKIDDIHYWTDSTIVLAWIRAPANKWKTFVSNRVSAIQQLSESDQWKHVRTFDNPADKLSRGTTAIQILEDSLWWTGPEWLIEDQTNWPQQLSIDIPDGDCLEVRSITALLVQSQTELEVFTKFSNIHKLKRVIAYCHRFKHNTLNKLQQEKGPLTVNELQRAHKTILKQSQKSFGAEIADLTKGRSIAKNSKLLPLNPFLDKDGLLRVGGRLKKANIMYDQKHPVLLPKNHFITNLIIRNEHERLLHAGPQCVLASLRLNYWPISGRNIVRHVTRTCITCFKCKPTQITHLMGDLPQSRTEAGNRPFHTCGVDYCGPIQVRDNKRRGRITTTKGYIAVFVCFTTKAVHLELVSDLTSEAFIGALRRFTSRRGICYHLYSDNATNFVGANRELKEIYDFLSSNDPNIKTELAKQNITWHNIPPRSPHFGGLWEAAVKSVKHHLRRVAGNNLFTFEEVYTLLTQIEACLNSRPLTCLSNDPNDLSVLTPAHFIIGDTLINPIEPSYLHLPTNKLSRWELVQQVKQHFWRRWSKEYLNQLQERSKWKTSSSKQLTVGTLVLIAEDNLPPLKWKTARVIELHPGTDGVVRVATVKTTDSIFKRSTTKLCILPLDI